MFRREKIDSGSLNLQAEKVVYSEWLELWREFKWEVLEKTGADRAQSCMDLCLLLVFCAVKVTPNLRGATLVDFFFCQENESSSVKVSFPEKSKQKY